MARTATQTFEWRFWGKVRIGQPGACWPWAGCANYNGYGIVVRDGSARLAHRCMWEVFNGRMIPKGLVICHSCDNPVCVNPAHLWMGTVGDNVRDMTTKGRHAAQQRTHCTNGHEYTPENIYPYRGKRYCRACSKRSRIIPAIEAAQSVSRNLRTEG